MVIRIRKIVIPVILAVLIAVGCLFFYSGSRHFYRQSYPLGYSETVMQYAAEYALPPAFVFAVIKTESGFDPNAVSEVDARGLMQVAETTFEWIRGKLGDGDAVFSDMFIPEKNIRYGVFLLQYLYEEFGSFELAAAAYHAGRGAVNGWLQDETLSSDGETLERIPSSVTAHYVNKVMRAYEKYGELYPELGGRARFNQ